MSPSADCLVDIETLWLDRGYDSELTRTRLVERGINDAMIAKKRKPGSAKGTKHQPMGLRWPVERTNSLALELRSAPTKYRPIHHSQTSPVRPGRGPDHHGQAGQMVQTLGLTGGRLMARALMRLGHGNPPPLTVMPYPKAVLSHAALGFTTPSSTSEVRMAPMTQGPQVAVSLCPSVGGTPSSKTSDYQAERPRGGTRR